MDIDRWAQTLAVTQPLLRVIGELDEFKGAWRAAQALAPERLAAQRHGQGRATWYALP